MKIPNRISFFWSGGPLSWMRYMTFWSFRLLNPDWQIHLHLTTAGGKTKTWESGEQQDFDPPLQSRNYLPDLAALGVQIEQWTPPAGCESLSPVHLADLCRWGVLSKYGGWFADTDILFVDSMQRIHERYESDAKKDPLKFKEADVALPLCRDWLPTGVMGAVPENRFTSDLYVLARSQANPKRYQSAGKELILKSCGLDPVFPAEKKQVVRGLITGFPGTVFWLMHHLTFYRWEWFDGHVIFDKDQEAFPETVGIHWYAGSHSGQRANRKYTAENFRADAAKNAFCHYAADLIDGDKAQVE